MAQENDCGKERISLHYARRKFLKQSSALTALAIVGVQKGNVRRMHQQRY
jgi:hypothetical protein